MMTTLADTVQMLKGLLSRWPRLIVYVFAKLAAKLQGALLKLHAQRFDRR